MAELLGAIFMVFGTAENSTGLCVSYLLESLELEGFGPLMTAVYLTNVKSTSSS